MVTVLLIRTGSKKITDPGGFLDHKSDDGFMGLVKPRESVKAVGISTVPLNISKGAIMRDTKIKEQISRSAELDFASQFSAMCGDRRENPPTGVLIQ